MVEMELPKNPTRKQKQPISVPFVWETKPGIPKNDWKLVRPSRAPPPPPPHHPIKLMASVPFVWEEKPGKPLPSYEYDFDDEDEKGSQIRSLETVSPKTSVGTFNTELPIYEDEKESIYESFGNEVERMFELELEKYSFKTDEPIRSVPEKPLSHHPIKLIASVPFEWEEKPGTPLPFYENNFGNKDEKEIVSESFRFETGESFGNEEVMIFESDFEKFSFKTDELIRSVLEEPPRPQLIASIPFEWEEKPGKPLASFPFSPRYYSHYADENVNSFGADENEVISESDSETLSFHTDESDSSVPSLLANCLVPAVAIANAIPVLETPPSPPGYESDSSTSSYATGTTSLVGAPFLEKLFPLLSPKLSFPENSKRCEEKENISKDHKMEFPRKDSVCESSFSGAIRRPATLGELIMMSRRRSYVRKVVQIRTHNSMGSMKKGAIGCFMFDINNKIEGLQRKMKRQFQLKLI